MEDSNVMDVSAERCWADLLTQTALISLLNDARWEGRKVKQNTNLEWKLLQQLLTEVEQTEVEEVVGLLAELPPKAELTPDQSRGLSFLLTVSLTFKQTK